MSVSKISDLFEKIQRGLAVKDNGLSKIELDVLMAHVRDLYEELDALRNGKTEVHQLVTNQNTRNTHERPQHELMPVKGNIFGNAKLLLGDTLGNETPEIPAKVETMATKPEVKPVPKPEIKTPEQRKVSTINESVAAVDSLNEKIRPVGNEVHKRLAIKPLKDLIDLNKRFALLNELFKGNAEAFSASVHHIDSLTDYGAAKTFVQTQLVTNYAWDESSPSVILFMKLVKQKFGVD